MPLLNEEGFFSYSGCQPTADLTKTISSSTATRQAYLNKEEWALAYKIMRRVYKPDYYKETESPETYHSTEAAVAALTPSLQCETETLCASCELTPDDVSQYLRKQGLISIEHRSIEKHEGEPRFNEFVVVRRVADVVHRGIH